MPLKETQLTAPDVKPRHTANPVFSRLPPAVFPPILGLLGLALALRMAAGILGLVPVQALADLAAGIAVALWAFAVIGLKIKNFRRFSVVLDDLRPLPGRAGYAAATMGGMAAGSLLVPFAPGTAMVLIILALVAHLFTTGVVFRLLLPMGPEARQVNPVWFMSLCGFIVAAAPLAALGQTDLARAILWIVIALALPILFFLAVQLAKQLPPAPLRPLLFISIAPAALISQAASALGNIALSVGFLALAILIFVGLVAGLRWILVAGFSPMWGAMTFPLAAFAGAMMAAGGWFQTFGLVLTAGLVVAIPIIAWRILKLWPGGQLAVKTNAAVA